MRYIGSKTATLPWLGQMVSDRAPDARSLCDPFAGTCVVARHFKGLGLRVVTGDELELSYVLQRATIELDGPPVFAGLRRILGQANAVDPLDYLNRLSGKPGYFHDTFSPAGEAGRVFFTSENAARIDAIRDCIVIWRRNGLITGAEPAYLLASLLDAADRVANTAGTYYAHLKSVTRKADRPLRLVPPPTSSAGQGSQCFRMDARQLVQQTNVDILYLDPPYNGRDYARYYHLPETLVSGAAPLATGKSGAPKLDRDRSDFYRPSRATDALADICKAANARHIVVHYTTDGIISHDDVLDMLQNRGETRFDDFGVRAYSATKSGAARPAQHRVYWCDVSDGRTPC